MAGAKNSLNVSVAFGVVAYHLRNSLKASLPAT
jgi:tRNA G18 (ribose-2'-O)-methylase SpoU